MAIDELNAENFGRRKRSANFYCKVRAFDGIGSVSRRNLESVVRETYLGWLGVSGTYILLSES